LAKKNFEQLQTENNDLKKQVLQLSQDLDKSRKKLEAEVIKEYDLMEKLSELEAMKKQNERLKKIIHHLMDEVELERARLDLITIRKNKARMRGE
jgi:hypothetical protein